MVVNGATGNVGEGIVRSLLKAGAKVIALSRTTKRLNELRGHLAGENLESLVIAAGDTSSFEGFRTFADRLAAEHGPFDHAVSTVNLGWGPTKPVWETSEADFDQYLTPNLKAHYAAARALAPHLRNGGTYTFIAGMSAMLPIPGASLVGAFGGAELMLGTSLQADAGERFRVNTLVLGFIVARNRPQGRADWLTADDVGVAIGHVINSSARGQQLVMSDRPTTAKVLEELPH